MSRSRDAMRGKEMQCGHRLFLVDLSCHSGIFLMAHGCYLMFVILSYLLLLSLAEEQRRFNSSCPSFSCGKFRNINFPYSKRTNPECGFCLVDDCDKPVQKIQLGKDEPWLYVTSISQDRTVTLYDQVFQRHLDNRSCESFKNISLPSSPSISFEILSNLTLFKCPTILGNIPMNFNMSCDDSTIYYNHPDDDDLPSLPPQCSLIQLPVAVSKTRYASDLFDLLTGNFSLKVCPNWRARRQCIDCPSRGGGQCLINSKGYLHCSNEIVATESYGHRKLKLKLGLGLGISVAAGVCMMIIIAICSRRIISSDYSMISWKKKNENYQNIETFLRNCGSLAPKRYGYSATKKITNSFKHKLGQGGYGCVYKGKLLDGRNVAVKLLNESKGNGEEFINEVASISRTSHVNVVTLLGFCFDGRRRALIYEFVSNGSLEKFIYRNSSSIENHKLTWETLFQIAVGIARGLEYLHRGCSTRILHFDIKPHNILLDEDFCPKISDFGLAKICNRKESIVSMTGARGTVGYIAPEVFCRNIGEVSYKSDVYSYGMMVTEMTGGRKNIDIGVSCSDVYFPHWIYKRLEKDEELGLQGIENEEDKEYARKMIIVSLWCIQTPPSSRPTMSRVVEMLEGNLDSLQIPPRPFLSSPGSPGDSSTIQSMQITL